MTPRWVVRVGLADRDVVRFKLPEVAGGAAVLVDPYDPVAIADGICKVLTDEVLRRDLREKGLARARQFSWEESVRRVRAIYGEICPS